MVKQKKTIIQGEKKGAFWARHLEVSLKSRLTQTEYCKKHGLSSSAYYYWKRRLGDPKRDESPEPLRFVTLESKSQMKSLNSQSCTTPAIQINMGAYSVEACADVDLSHLENVLRVLGRLSCGK